MQESENKNKGWDLVKSLFWKGDEAKDKTDAEVHQRLTEVGADLKTEVVQDFASKLLTEFNTQLEAKAADYATKLKSEVDGVIGEIKLKVDGFEKSIKELKPDTTEIEKKFADFKTEVGTALNTVKINLDNQKNTGDGNAIKLEGEGKTRRSVGLRIPNAELLGVKQIENPAEA